MYTLKLESSVLDKKPAKIQPVVCVKPSNLSLDTIGQPALILAHLSLHKYSESLLFQASHKHSYDRALGFLLRISKLKTLHENEK